MMTSGQRKLSWRQFCGQSPWPQATRPLDAADLEKPLSRFGQEFVRGQNVAGNFLVRGVGM